MIDEIAKLRQELARSQDAQRVSRACIPPTLLLDYTTVNDWSMWFAFSSSDTQQ